MTDKITEAVEKLTELTGIEGKEQFENAVFSVNAGMYEIGVKEVTTSERAGVDILSGSAVIAEPQVTLEGTPLDVEDRFHSLSEFVEQIERGDYEFVRVEK